ncbi:MAG TPA: FkbM family methyltransferase [Candidatus Marinimicrobia bacterium]|jgi:FkbM family methyltransferase|nr:FkbM family methyltransferase [Candidatus Neomarinimicrobiota bacterium]|tara:strand:+ start:14850 stop:15716 length:867 start_codon:yes stop_codon:yes gene_type:complete
MDFIKNTLKRFGLYLPLEKLKRKLSPSKRNYSKLKTFNVIINNRSISFTTADDYSNGWFYPRYTDGKVHEKPVTESILIDLKNHSCFVDVGANLGWYTCVAAKHLDQGVVYSFEMDNLNFEILKKNISLNQCSNVNAFHRAVSQKNGEMKYVREFERPSPNFKLNQKLTDSHSQEVTVKSISLDSFFEEEGIPPEIIKIDVEGAEMDVLKGMKTILKNQRPKLYLEVHPSNLVEHFNSSALEVLNYLKEIDYTLYEIQHMREQVDEPFIVELNNLHINDNSMIIAQPS